MTNKFSVACVQNCAGPDIQANIDDSVQLCREARSAGADLICTPEFFTCLDKSDDGLMVGAFPEPDHPGLAGRDLTSQGQITDILDRE